MSSRPLAPAGPSRSATIDGLRAVAVLLVLLTHTVHPDGPPLLMAIGDHGVDLFFVISGLCLSLALERDAKPRVLPFVVARFVRIAPPYYVAIALFAALALTNFGYPTAPPGADLSPLASARELMADVLFSGSGAPIHDTSFWTLGVEMRWYVLCVPFVLIWRASRPLFLALAAAFYLAYWCTPFGIYDEGMLPAFMLGIVASAIGRVPPRLVPVIAAGTAALVAATIVVQWRDLVISHASPLWHLAAFALVVCGRLEPFSRAFAWRPLAAIGTASYSIYLVHEPILNALRHARVASPLAALAALAGGIAFWALVERPLARPDRRDRLVATILRPLRRRRRETANVAGAVPAAL